MASLTAEQTAPPKRGLNTWDSPWLNAKFIIGFILVLGVGLMGFFGNFFWDLTLARAASSPLNVVPMWDDLDPDSDDPKEQIRVMQFLPPDPAHPLGTESNGRDMLAVMLVGSARSLRIGVIAAGLGMAIGIILGFSSGFMGGWVDSVIRVIADAFITIPALAVLIVIAAYVRQVSVENLALLLALFLWPGPTRLIRAQVLTLRERGYVQMARLSGASTFDIMFKEMMPNMLPYLAASFTGNVSGAILAATGLEVLGLGPTRIPTLGMTIFYAIRSSAIIRGMSWWWGTPIAALVVIFTGLFLMTVGLDEIANPRLRGVKSQ